MAIVYLRRNELIRRNYSKRSFGWLVFGGREQQVSYCLAIYCLGTVIKNVYYQTIFLGREERWFCCEIPGTNQQCRH